MSFHLFLQLMQAVYLFLGPFLAVVVLSLGTVLGLVYTLTMIQGATEFFHTLLSSSTLLVCYLGSLFFFVLYNCNVGFRFPLRFQGIRGFRRRV